LLTESLLAVMSRGVALLIAVWEWMRSCARSSELAAFERCHTDARVLIFTPG
jgi:hypothetical protein